MQVIVTYSIVIKFDLLKLVIFSIRYWHDLQWQYIHSGCYHYGPVILKVIKIGVSTRTYRQHIPPEKPFLLPTALSLSNPQDCVLSIWVREVAYRAAARLLLNCQNIWTDMYHEQATVRKKIRVDSSAPQLWLFWFSSYVDNWR
jgi:hypothetical protein